MAFEFKNSKGVSYYLHTREVILKGGRAQRIYFFCRDCRPGSLDAVPEGGRIWVHACTAEFTPGGEITWNRSAPGPLPAFLSPGALQVPSPPLDWQAGAMGREWVIFSVVDSGCGIPAENLALVFEPFFTTKESGQGTGLGLAICQAVIHAVGGAIWAWSEPGVGTRFSFTLPSSGPS